MKEYDAGDGNGLRKLFLSASDAENDNNELGNIVDYGETITPVIGKVKPSNFFLQQRGLGFNSDSDIVLSKGRLSEGTPAYNSTFGLSYFDPQFFTKILLEDVPVSGFDEGKYVYGINSGAYGVVEGAPSGVYTAGSCLLYTSDAADE